MADQSLARFISSSFQFSGRASRSEYWKRFGKSVLVVCVFQWVVILALYLMIGSDAIATGPISLANMPLGAIILVSLGMICFLTLSTTARRFQDHGWSGRWFQWMFYLLALAATCVAITVAGILMQNATFANAGFSMGFLTLFPIYASIIWTIWIGFVKADTGSNQYGPNPLEASK
jgi:uncharacterized membrane protein YhaH (DUF805 family)